MIPLRRNSSISGENEFSIEVTFIVGTTAMSSHGKVKMEFPSFDTPINRLLISCLLPNDFIYGEFDGNIREIKDFGEISGNSLQLLISTDTVLLILYILDSILFHFDANFSRLWEIYCYAYHLLLYFEKKKI